MDCEKYLNDILRKYNINYMYPEIDWYFQIREIWQELLSESNNVLVISDKEDELKQIKRIVQEQTEIWENIKFFLPDAPFIESIRNVEGCTVVISSLDIGFEIEMELFRVQEFKNDLKIINIYSLFREKGIYITVPFYKMEVPFIDYCDIYCTRMKLKCNENKKFYLEKLICQCLEIRDFISAESFIDEYILEGYDEGNYEKFKVELKEFLTNLKEKIHKRKQRDIIVNWIDNLGSDIEKMPFLENKKEESIYFENAYTNVPWTRSTMLSIITGLKAIEGKTYLPLTYNENNSQLLRMIKKSGYQFKYYAGPQFEYRFRYFPKGNHINYDDKNYNYNNINLKSNMLRGTSAKLQWGVLCTLAVDDRPHVIIVHNIVETHPPFLNSQSKYFDKKNIIQGCPADKNTQQECVNNSKVFFDHLLEFYDQFYSNNLVRIVLSDHGDSFVNRVPFFSNAKSKILMMIYGDVQRAIIRDFYCHTSFHKIIEGLISGKNIQIPSKKYVLLENIDFYSGQREDKFFDNLKQIEGNYYLLSKFMQYRAIKTEIDTYVCFSNGHEIYYLNKDEEVPKDLIASNIKNRINYVENIGRIEYLRELCGNNFIDVLKSGFFSESLKIYKFANCPSPYIRKREEILRKIIYDENIYTFLTRLINFRDKLLIFCVVDDNARSGVSGKILRYLDEIGCHIGEYEKEFSYLSIVDQGVTLIEESSNSALHIRADINGFKVQMSSFGIYTGHCCSSCIVNGFEYITDRSRGLSMIIFDREKKEEILTVKMDIFDGINKLIVCD